MNKYRLGGEIHDVETLLGQRIVYVRFGKFMIRSIGFVESLQLRLVMRMLTNGDFRMAIKNENN